MESTSEMETALQFYEAARDNLSLVRVYCYCGNLEKVSCACRIRLQSISAKRGTNVGFYFHAKPILRERVFASLSTSVERLQGPSGILVFCSNFSSLNFFTFTGSRNLQWNGRQSSLISSGQTIWKPGQFTFPQGSVSYLFPLYFACFFLSFWLCRKMNVKVYVLNALGILFQTNQWNLFSFSIQSGKQQVPFITPNRL